MHSQPPGLDQTRCLRRIRCSLTALLLVSCLTNSPAAQMPAAASANDPRCGASKEPDVSVIQPAGTVNMVRRLKALREQGEWDPMSNPFLGSVRVQRVESDMNAALAAGNTGRAIELRWKLAGELLNAGLSHEAFRQFNRYREETARAGWRLDFRQAAALDLQSAICALRIGEQANCIHGHTPDSCLLPIQGTGIHRDATGSRVAIRILTGRLAGAPEDLSARWLLNVAFMTTGGYPREVPQQWLIPPRSFESEFKMERFRDVAGTLGLDVNDNAGGCIFDDFDGDGFLDLMASSSNLGGQLRYFRNLGDGRFEERTLRAGLGGLCGGLNLVQADYDNDGHLDLLVLRGAWLGNAGRHPNSLLRNLGNGTFEDVTEAAGMLGFHPTGTAVWFDFNNDGWLDLFVGNESTQEEVHPCELYRNNGNGTFTECARECGLAITGFIKGVTSADYDRDGHPDLYLSNLRGSNLLFHNDGPRESASGAGWRFSDQTSLAGVEAPERSFTTWFWDFDNDGWEDLFVSGYGYAGVGDIAADYLGLSNTAEKPRLYRNLGNGRFEEISQRSGLNRVLLTMGGNFGDLDNDGWLDFYVGTGEPSLTALIPNRMFRNNSRGVFQDVTTSGGFGHLQKGHAIAFADYDNDGDQDVYTVLGGAFAGDVYPNALYQNPGTSNRFVRLTLQGSSSNRSAIGARVHVLASSSAGSRSIWRTVNSGGSFGAGPLRREIGLGQATSIGRIEIFWPGQAQPQTIHGVEVGGSYLIRQNQPANRLETTRIPGLSEGIQARAPQP